MTPPLSRKSAFTPSGRRLWTACLVCASGVHLGLLYGLVWLMEPPAEPPRAMEITLAHLPSRIAPDKADYLAQEHQIGSGTLEKEALPSNDQEARFQSEEPTPASLNPTPPPPPPGAPGLTDHLTITSLNAPVSLPELSAFSGEEAEPQPRQQDDFSREIASLEADFLEKQQAYARRPVIHRMNTASARKADILYQEVWRRKVMQTGALHYPAEAKKQGIYGELRLAVQIYSDGHLKKVEIIHSSGQSLLDEAALRIVQLAAPFDPFPPELYGHDLIEIIRTWRFEPGGILRD